MIDPLSRLAILHGTDKFGYHDYTPNYFSLLESWRMRPLRMLEIGVGGYGFEDRGGESLATWRDFFPQAQITAIDIQRKTVELGPRVRILQGSQVDAPFLAGVVAERGPFDIILDDGSHRNEHVIETFELLFDGLAPGGIYLIEDVQTAFMPRYGGSLTLKAPNSVGYFADRLVDLTSGRAGEITAIERFHNIIVLHKRGADAAPLPAHGDRRIRAALEAGRSVRRADPALALAPELAAHEGDNPGILIAEAGQAGDASTLSALIDQLGPEGVILLQGGPVAPGLLREIFTQIDHREIRANYPEASIPDYARRILSLSVHADGAVLEIGDNTYPSNFDFDPHEPRAAAALKVMDEVMQDPAASGTGLLQYAGILQRFSGIEAAFDLVERLAASGCTDRRYYQLAILRMQRLANWSEVLRLSDEALAQLPDNPHFVTTKARAMRMLGQGLEAEALLRAAYARDPRGRAVVVALARLEQDAGRMPEAIALYEQSINLFPAGGRPAQLRSLITLCESAGAQQAAIRASQQLIALVPEDVLAQRILAGAAQEPGSEPG